MLNEISKKLPFFRFEDHTMVYNDGSLGVGFKLQGLDISCAPPETINNFCQKLENFLVGLPDQLRVQVFYRLTNYVQDTIDQHSALSTDATSLYQPIREARLDFLNEKKNAESFYLPEIYLFIRSKPFLLKKRKLFERKTEFEGVPAHEFQKQKEQFYILVSQVESSMKSMSLEPSRLLKDDWFSLLFSYFNLERADTIGSPKLRDFSDPLAPTVNTQIALTDISVSEKQLEIGNYKFRSVSLGLLPEGETHASMIEVLTKLPFHFWLSQNIRTLEQRKEIEKLELMRKVATSMASGSQNVSDIESESKLSQLEGLLRELMDGSEKLVASDMNIIFWGETDEEMERKAEEILRAFRGMSQAA